MSGNENLGSTAGVEPAMRLADAAGLDRLAARYAGPGGAQAASTPLKIGCLVTGMLMGADSIDGMNVLRDCGLHHVLCEVRAPSTPGSFLRAFSHGNVRQLDAVHRRLLAGLAARAPLLPGKDVLAYPGIDACQRRVYGVTKQGAGFSATKIQGKVVTVRGLNLLGSSLSTRTGAPLISGVRLRGGSANCTRGAASFLREQIGTAPRRRRPGRPDGHLLLQRQGHHGLPRSGPASRSRCGWTRRCAAASPRSLMTSGPPLVPARDLGRRREGMDLGYRPSGCEMASIRT